MIDVNLMPGVEEDVDAELNYNEDFLEIDGISISLQSLGNVINGIIDKGYIEASDVASFESISPGCLLDNHTINEFGGVFSSITTMFGYRISFGCAAVIRNYRRNHWGNRCGSNK